MAKILDKLFPPHKRLITQRQNAEWIKAELESLPQTYQDKRLERVAVVAKRYNKRISASAFTACDKTEYAESVAQDKLKRYDVKTYMSYRAINHAYSKAIFKALKKGESYDEATLKHQERIKNLQDKRVAFIEKLNIDKQAFIDKNPVTDGSEYERLKAEYSTAFEIEKANIENELNEKLNLRKDKLNNKLAKIQAKIDELTKLSKTDLTLPDGVLLSVKDLKMYFGGLKAVDELTFDVKKGEIFGLIGPNGAGKTTVFNCITRFYNATGGDILFENKYGEVVDMRKFKVHDVILQGISRTFQNVELVKEISVIDNLLVASTREYKTNIFMQALGIPTIKKEERLLKAKAMSILKFMGIESYASWYAMGLPYGILKKVEIARALMADAKLIIMDEPAAGLNDTETAELTQTIRRIRDEFNVTILLVEHDMSLVMSVCDTVCAISFGKMLAIGTTDEIKNNKAVQEAYLGVADDEEGGSNE